MQARTRLFAMLFLLALAGWNVNRCPAATISGTVTDDYHGTGVAGALVEVKGTTESTHTDANGAFTLTPSAIRLPGKSAGEELSLPADGRATLYGADGTDLARGRSRDLAALASPLPDGMYLFVVRTEGAEAAGKLLKAGAQCQTGPLQSAAKAAADVTLVISHTVYRTREQSAAEGDGSVQVSLTQKKGWELNPADVGLAGAGVDKNSLTEYTGNVDGSTGNIVPPAGSRISGKRFTAPVALFKGDIILEKCLFQPKWVGTVGMFVTTVDYNTFRALPAKVIIRDCEFDGSQMTPRDGWSLERTVAGALGFQGVVDIQRCYFHNMGSGIAVKISGNQFDCLIEQNVVRDLVGWGDPGTTGSHNNACTIRDFTDAARPDRKGFVRNNHLELYCEGNASSSLQISGTDGVTANFTAQGNFLDGYGYNLWLSHAGSGFKNMKAIDNRFRPLSGWLSYADSPGWVVWQDNYRYQPAAPPECIGPPVY